MCPFGKRIYLNADLQETWESLHLIFVDLKTSGTSKLKS